MTGGTHVLVVDDQQDFRDSLIQVLALEGFRATGASSGHEALALLEANRGDAFHVVLMDYRMPGLDGGATLRAMRARGIATPAILVSAAAGLDHLCGENGFQDAVPKPCDLLRLVEAIRRYGPSNCQSGAC